MELQKTLNDQRNLQKEDKAGDTTRTHLKLHYKARVIKTVMYTGIKTDTDRWNRMGSLEINPLCTCGQLIFDKSQDMRIIAGKYIRNGAGKTGHPLIQKNETGPLRYTIHKSNEDRLKT